MLIFKSELIRANFSCGCSSRTIMISPVSWSGSYKRTRDGKGYVIHDSHQDVHVYPNHTVVNDECKERLTPGACKAEVIVIDTYFLHMYVATISMYIKSAYSVSTITHMRRREKECETLINARYKIEYLVKPFKPTCTYTYMWAYRYLITMGNMILLIGSTMYMREILPGSRELHVTFSSSNLTCNSIYALWMYMYRLQSR